MDMPAAGIGLRLAGWARVLLPLGVLGLMLLVNDTLCRWAAWERVGRNWAGTALLAIALTPAVITGGIDLSVGSVVGLAAVVSDVLCHRLGVPVGLALAGGVAAGLAAGVANGTLVLAGVSPLVATLATLAVFRGLAQGLHGAAPPANDFPELLQTWWESDTLGVPHPVWMVAATFAVFYVFLHHTWMGRMLYAIGDNERAARYAGVPVRTLRFGLYAVSGLVAGVVGLATVCESRSAPPSQGEGLELLAVACVVLGGVRITGGAGHLAGTLLGTLTLAALLEGMVWVPARWRPVLTGTFLVVVAVANEAVARAVARSEAAFSESKA